MGGSEEDKNHSSVEELDSPEEDKGSLVVVGDRDSLP